MKQGGGSPKADSPPPRWAHWCRLPAATQSPGQQSWHHPNQPRPVLLEAAVSEPGRPSERTNIGLQSVRGPWASIGLQPRWGRWGAG